MIILYTTNWCPYCIAAKNFFKENNLEFKEINIELENIDRKDLEHIIKGAYHPAIEWLIPAGPLPDNVQFSDVPAVDLADDRLNRAHRQFRYLVKGGPDMKQAKREDIYLNILRSVHESEAKLLMSVVGKKIPYKGMTRALMLETFPDWLPVSNTLTE